MNREYLKDLLEGTINEFAVKDQQKREIKNRLTAARKEIDGALNVLKGTSPNEIDHITLLKMAKQLDQTIKGIK